MHLTLTWRNRVPAAAPHHLRAVSLPRPDISACRARSYQIFLCSCALLVQIFFYCPVCTADESLVRQSDDRLPGEVFNMSVRDIWGVIRSQKDLNLPAHKVLVLAVLLMCACVGVGGVCVCRGGGEVSLGIGERH